MKAFALHPGIDMRLPVSRRYRHVVFAGVMSFVTSLIVSGAITASRAGLDNQYLDHWVKGFFVAWPLVFIVILLIAPLVSRFVEAIVEET
jgi:uncharacterized membrane protein YcfT